MLDNIKVAVRLRAPLSREIGHARVAHVISDTVISTELPDKKSIERQFQFDQCFPSSEKFDDDQENIYELLARDYLLHALDGYNTCIFAYGQTGSGKSHTMTGRPQSPGLIPRICEELFEIRDLLASSEDEIKTHFNIKCSYLEIYNEQVRDLLGNEKCRVREKADRTTFVEGLQEFDVHNVEQILKYLNQGNEVRVTGATHLNENSSRSHAIFTIALEQKEISPLGQVIERHSSIKLIDLAGSERAIATGFKGDRFKEGIKYQQITEYLRESHIDVGEKNKPKLIPYRDSALTWVLKECLGGNSRTCMIACVSPYDYEETVSTLRYATIAKCVKTTALVNSYETSEEKDQIDSMRRQLEELQETLSQLQDRKAIQDKMEKIKLTNEFLDQRIKRERKLAADYYDQWSEASIERDQLAHILLSIAGSIQTFAEPDLQSSIEKLQKESKALGHKIESDLSFCDKLSGLE